MKVIDVRCLMKKNQENSYENFISTQLPKVLGALKEKYIYWGFLGGWLVKLRCSLTLSICILSANLLKEPSTRKRKTTKEIYWTNSAKIQLYSN